MAKKPEANLLDLTPRRLVEWETSSENRTDLIVPKFKRSLFIKMIERLGKSPVVQIHLDDFGSHVWQYCDGKHTVYEIGQELRSKYGESVEPVFDRLSGFIRLLVHYKYITLSSDIQK
ncbi:PqqD family protein [bacterium]